MARPKAEDVLDDFAAREVREVISDVRRLKCVTNTEIAEFLGSDVDVRWVTNALAKASKLRASKAKAIIDGLAKMEPRTREAQKRIEAARPWLNLTIAARHRPPEPAAIIPSKDVAALATLLAEALAASLKKRPTRRPQRATLRNALKRALSNARLPMATTFADRYEARFTAGGYLAYVMALRDFGDPKRFDRIFRRRRSDGIASLNEAAQYLEDLGVDRAEALRLMAPVYRAARERIGPNDFPDSLESED
jgi:hypothetical protein